MKKNNKKEFRIQQTAVSLLVFLCVSVVWVSLFLSPAFGDTDANSYRTTLEPGYSVVQGVATRITGNVADKLMGRIYGILEDVDFAFVGTDADGITLTIYERPIMVSNDFSWPLTSKIEKFTYTFTSAASHRAPETETINSNVAVGALFTGDVYITVTGTAGTVTAIYINVIFREEIRPYRNYGQ
jgi:hypothetical protein